MQKKCPPAPHARAVTTHQVHVRAAADYARPQKLSGQRRPVVGQNPNRAPAGIEI